MNINLFTFVVQIINFLVLMFILNKLIYRPLIKAIRDRQKYIRSTINNAENKFKEAEKTRIEYETELKQIEIYKQEQIKKIDEELSSYKIDEINKIKEELKIEKKHFIDQLENEKNSIIEGLIGSFCYNISGLLNNIFVSLSNTSFNSIILNKFLNEIHSLSDDSIEKINKSSSKTINFSSSFELTQEEKNNVKDTLKKCGITIENIEFTIDKDMVFGNRINVDGLVINSNIQDIVDKFVLNLKKNMN